MPSVVRQEKLRLKELLEGPEIAERANCIYVLRWHGRPMYVGKTTIGVRERIKLHINRHTNIGSILENAMPLCYGWWVEILWIDQGLLEIERNVIVELQPPLNKYKKR